jgi:hypothetical protein
MGSFGRWQLPPQSILTGDSVYEGANATISLAVTPFEEQQISSITSNSTLTGLSFNPATRELTFSVSGPEGTAGYVNVYFSKLLVSNISDLKVNLDQTPLAYAAESQGENWLVSFTYGASTHQVTMNLGSAPANGDDDQSGQWVAYGVAIAAAATVPVLLFVRKRKTGKSKLQAV